jgi:hypothetical protein
MSTTPHTLWTVDEDALAFLDACKARDLVVECFSAAQQETFAHSKEALGLEVDSKALSRSVVGAVRAAFRKTGGDYDDPTKQSIMKAIDALAVTSASWGTPRHIVEHHYAEIEKVLGKLEA